MIVINAAREIDAPAEKIFELIEDFGHIERWWPRGDGFIRIDHVDLEGSGLGMVRHIYNVGMPHAVSERLDALDREQLSWRLSIVGERPAGLLRYQAHGQLTPLGPDRCRIAYRGEFETKPGSEEEARTFLSGAYELMFEGLEQAARRELQAAS